MEKDTVNLDTSNEGFSLTDFEGLEGDALKEKVKEFSTKHLKVLDANRQLFERAKKAEGFEKNEEGDWVKSPVKPKEKPEAPKKSEKSDEKLLERLETLALRVANVTADDEKELYVKWKESTGREADEILGNKIFQAELNDLRTARANQDATSGVKGETGASGVKNTPEYWIAKATKGADGQLLFSDEMPRELYSKVLDTLAKNTPGASEDLKFYNK